MTHEKKKQQCRQQHNTGLLSRYHVPLSYFASFTNSLSCSQIEFLFSRGHPNVGTIHFNEFIGVASLCVRLSSNTERGAASTWKISAHEVGGSSEPLSDCFVRKPHTRYSVFWRWLPGRNLELSTNSPVLYGLSRITQSACEPRSGSL